VSIVVNVAFEIAWLYATDDNVTTKDILVAVGTGVLSGLIPGGGAGTGKVAAKLGAKGWKVGYKAAGTAWKQAPEAFKLAKSLKKLGARAEILKVANAKKWAKAGNFAFPAAAGLAVDIGESFAMKGVESLLEEVNIGFDPVGDVADVITGDYDWDHDAAVMGARGVWNWVESNPVDDAWDATSDAVTSGANTVWKAVKFW
jgi:hypothetical protein